MKIMFFILLLIIGCTSVPDQQAITLSDLKSDFPEASVVSMKPIQTFEILPFINAFMVKDSVMFVIENNSDNAGHCYSVNRGKQISVIMGRGNAANEFTRDPYMRFIFNADSIQFTNPNLGIMKIFATDDIVTKPMSERAFSTVKIPDFHLLNEFSRIGENMYIGSYYRPTEEQNNKYFIYDEKGFTLFGDFERELFDTDIEVSNNVIESAFDPLFARYKDKVVMVNGDGILLQIIDLNKTAVEKEDITLKLKLKKVKRGIEHGLFLMNIV